MKCIVTANLYLCSSTIEEAHQDLSEIEPAPVLLSKPSISVRSVDSILVLASELPDDEAPSSALPPVQAFHTSRLNSVRCAAVTTTYETKRV